MASDPELVERLREWFAERGVTNERRMFGGHAFLDAGRMTACANSRGELMVRCDPDTTDQLAAEPGVVQTEMRGRPMKGWLDIEPAAVTDDVDLARWLSLALTYARSLPRPKGPRGSMGRAKRGSSPGEARQRRGTSRWSRGARRYPSSL